MTGTPPTPGSSGFVGKSFGPAVACLKTWHACKGTPRNARLLSRSGRACKSGGTILGEPAKVVPRATVPASLPQDFFCSPGRVDREETAWRRTEIQEQIE